jgi:hypothetical protein
MVVPKSGRGTPKRPSGVVAPVVALDGQVTEIRVHGVGGTPPDALLDDLAPEQVGGDRVAGFYRAADLESTTTGSSGVNRHVEAYSWGGLTSRSGVRVLWLLLMPFMLANLAGWMYRGRLGADGHPQGVRFACHRVACGLACLALTVNTALVGVLIAVDLLSYQAPRAGLAGRWWLWPLSWTWVRGHGERPLVVGFAAVAVVIGLLTALAVRTQSRYEAVRPPWRSTADTKTGAFPQRSRGSAADRAMSDQDFWNSAVAVRRMTGAHIAAAVGFLAVTFAITARASAAGAPRELVWWWLAVIAGVLAMAVSVGVVIADQWAERQWVEAVSARLKLTCWPQRVVVHAVAPLGLLFAAVFAFRQPGMRVQPGSLPGIDGITAATYLALGVIIAVLVLVGLAGLLDRDGTRPGLLGGPAVVMTMAAGLLNSMLLGTLFAAGHALGPLHSNSHPGPGTINVPVVIGWSGPVLGAALLAAVLVYGVVQVISLTTGHQTPALRADLLTYQAGLAATLPGGAGDQEWVVAMVQPLDGVTSPDEPARQKAWQRILRMNYWFGGIRSSIALLLWLIAGLQAGGIIAIIVARPAIPDAGYSANGALGKTVILAATVVLVLFMWLLRAGWRSPQQRKRIGILWDVGTFWPRSYHPLAPPSYAERAVPDLQRRIWRLNDHKSPVLVAAHSQGTVLAAAALLQTGCRARSGKIGLATFGSPLCKMYGWAFPGYMNGTVLTRIAVPGGKEHADVKLWHNFSYPTDPIGGAITDAEQPVDAILTDRPLLDPELAWRIYDDPPPAPGGHTGYWTDDRVWHDIDDMADSLRRS